MHEQFTKESCIELRKEIKSIGVRVKKLSNLAKGFTEVTAEQDKGEMIANTMLAYRHLEDSAMRLGKAIQAHEGGISIYDKELPERDLNKEA